MQFIVEHKTSKGWEIAYEDEATLEGAVDRVKELVADNYQARLTVQPTITPR